MAGFHAHLLQKLNNILFPQRLCFFFPQWKVLWDKVFRLSVGDEHGEAEAEPSEAVRIGHVMRTHDTSTHISACGSESFLPPKQRVCPEHLLKLNNKSSSFRSHFEFINIWPPTFEYSPIWPTLILQVLFLGKECKQNKTKNKKHNKKLNKIKYKRK